MWPLPHGRIPADVVTMPHGRVSADVATATRQGYIRCGHRTGPSKYCHGRVPPDMVTATVQGHNRCGHCIKR